MILPYPMSPEEFLKWRVNHPQSKITPRVDDPKIILKNRKMFAQSILKRGGGPIAGPQGLGILVSTVDNIHKVKPGWIFVDITTATVDILVEALTELEQARKNWPDLPTRK